MSEARWFRLLNDRGKNVAGGGLEEGWCVWCESIAEKDRGRRGRRR